MNINDLNVIDDIIYDLLVQHQELERRLDDAPYRLPDIPKRAVELHGLSLLLMMDYQYGMKGKYASTTKLSLDLGRMRASKAYSYTLYGSMREDELDKLIATKGRQWVLEVVEAMKHTTGYVYNLFHPIDIYDALYHTGDDVVSLLTIPDLVYELMTSFNIVANMPQSAGVKITYTNERITNLLDEPMDKEDWYIGDYVTKL